MNKKRFYKEISEYYNEKTTDGVRWIMMNDKYSKKYKNAEMPDKEDINDYYEITHCKVCINKCIYSLDANVDFAQQIHEKYK